MTKSKTLMNVNPKQEIESKLLQIGSLISLLESDIKETGKEHGKSEQANAAAANLKAALEKLGFCQTILMDTKI